VGDKHLPRYLSEFDRRWNTRTASDGERTVNVIKTAPGKRLNLRLQSNKGFPYLISGTFTEHIPAAVFHILIELFMRYVYLRLVADGE
jgi:hypothetical protein